MGTNGGPEDPNADPYGQFNSSLADLSAISKGNSSMGIGLNDSALSGNSQIKRKNINLAKVQRLHSNFAQQILDLEMEIDSGTFDGDTVNKLFELYEKAVQFYNLQNNKKSKVFEKKIQNMLVRPEIMMAMSSASKKGPTKEQ